MNKPESWKTISSEPVADCRVFRVRRDACSRETDGKESDFFVIESPDWVNVIAVTGEDEIVLIEQFRHGVSEINLEIPSGIIDTGEQPIEAARRELEEETGYTATEWKLIGRSRPNPAIQNNTIYHYLALGGTKTAETAFDEHESITTRLVDRNEIPLLLKSGEISHSLATAAFHYWSLCSE